MMPSIRKIGIPGKRTLPPDFPVYRGPPGQWMFQPGAMPVPPHGGFQPQAHFGPEYFYDEDEEKNEQDDSSDSSAKHKQLGHILSSCLVPSK